ncbi:MFS transporter [Rhodococcus qingshengii]
MTTLAEAPTRSGSRVIAALAGAVLVYSLMQTMLVPALPVLGEHFDTSVAVTGWILTAYLLAAAVMAPIVGAMGDRFGDKRVLVIVLIIFALATFAAAATPNIGVLLVVRAVQGVSMASFPLATAVLRRTVVGPELSSGIGWLAGTLGIGAGSALVIGGVILEYLSWQWLFVITGILIVLALVAVVAVVPGSHRRPGMPTDWAGAGALAFGLVSLLLAITKASDWGVLSLGFWGLVVVAFVSFATLIAVDSRHDAPIVDMRVFRDKPMMITSALTLVFGFVPYIFYLCLPRILQAPDTSTYGSGFTVVQTGLALLPAAVLVFLGGRLTPALARRFGPRVPAVIALALMAAGAIGLAIWPSSVVAIVAFFSLVGLGNGVGFAVCALLVASIVPPSEMAAASGVNSVIRTVGSAVGAPVTTAVLAIGISGDSFALAFVMGAVISVVACLPAIALPATRTAQKS